jgi:nucleoid-associated protein YgaU
MVEPGDSLWRIVQTTYETSDTGATVALVDFVFDSNRDQLTDPSVLEVGMKLTVPELRF